MDELRERLERIFAEYPQLRTVAVEIFDAMMREKDRADMEQMDEIMRAIMREQR